MVPEREIFGVIDLLSLVPFLCYEGQVVISGVAGGLSKKPLRYIPLKANGCKGAEESWARLFIGEYAAYSRYLENFTLSCRASSWCPAGTCCQSVKGATQGEVTVPLLLPFPVWVLFPPLRLQKVQRMSCLLLVQLRVKYSLKGEVGICV